MRKTLKFNFLYFSLLCVTLLNLSCEKSEVFSPFVDENVADNYYFNITNNYYYLKYISCNFSNSPHDSISK